MDKNVTWLKRWITILIATSLIMGTSYVSKTQEGRQQLKQFAVNQIQKVVKTGMIEFLPVYDYEEYGQMEWLCRLTRSFAANILIPYWDYFSKYGVEDRHFLMDNLVPSFFYEKEEKVAKNSENRGKKKRSLQKKQLFSQRFLRKYFIQVDSTTTITNQELNGKDLFARDLSLNKKEKAPQILLYHTHGSEDYKDSRRGRATDTVVGVGTELERQLEKQGYHVLHDKTAYDIYGGKLDRSKAYYYAMKGIEGHLKRYPQIQVIIDLHRDGVANGTRLVTKIDGKNTAQVMFFNGMSRTATNGNIAYLKNPYKLWNLAFSLQMQKTAYEEFPGFTRKIYIKGYRYNLQYRKRSMLVEVGAQTNTVKEAKRAMKPLARVIASVLK